MLKLSTSYTLNNVSVLSGPVFFYSTQGRVLSRLIVHYRQVIPLYAMSAAWSLHSYAFQNFLERCGLMISDTGVIW